MADKNVCMYLFVCVAVCFPVALHNMYFLRLWHDIAYLCWKC